MDTTLPPHDLEMLLKKQYAERYIRTHRDVLTPECHTLVKLEHIEPLRAYSRKKTLLSFVARYDLRCGKRKKRILGRAPLPPLQKHEYNVHCAIFEGFKDARERDTVPEPYYFDGHFGIFFVSYIPGLPLYRVLIRQQPLPRGLAEAVILWLKQLQKIDHTRIRGLERRPDFGLVTQNLSRIRRRRPSFSENLERIWRSWKKDWTRHATAPYVLAHGDFNPTNLIMQRRKQKTRIAIVDLGGAHRAPKLWDLAALLAHLESLPELTHHRTRVIGMQQALLHYWEHIDGPLGAAGQRRLAYFQRYFLLLAATHMIIFGGISGPPLKHHFNRLLRKISS